MEEVFKKPHANLASKPFKESPAGIFSIKINGRNNSRPSEKNLSSYIIPVSQQGVNSSFQPSDKIAYNQLLNGEANKETHMAKLCPPLNNEFLSLSLFLDLIEFGWKL